MNPDISNGINCQVPVPRKQILIARPIAAGSSGEGLPYAPEDWPCAGDKWRWKVGKRMTNSGFWCDRYLCPPPRFLGAKVSGCKHGFSSRVLVEQFVRKEFPDVDIKSFFASFLWKIPSRNVRNVTPKADSWGNNHSQTSQKNSQLIEYPKSKSASTASGDCKAGNEMCSLHVRARTYSLAAMDCDICCSETGFCRDCCCILCSKIIDWTNGSYNLIRCEATVDRNFICGHAAHIDCALRAYMAGKVVGGIDLDVEYCCRRCDNKTDLMPYVTRLLHTCESIDSKLDIEIILNLGLCILGDSEQMGARSLRTRIELIMAKLKSQVYLGEMLKSEDNFPAVTAGNEASIMGSLNVTSNQKCLAIRDEPEPSHGNEIVEGRETRPVYITSDHNIAAVKLKDEIDQVLHKLRNSQELEYRLAEQKLYAHRDSLLNLYQQLEVERSELADPTPPPSGSNADSLLTDVLSRVDQIKHDELKLENMMQISKGFGRSSKRILKDYFGLLVDD